MCQAKGDHLKDTIYNNWGIAISDLAKQTGNEKLFEESFEKYQKASELNSTNDTIYNNWGSALCNFLKYKYDEEIFLKAETIIKQGVKFGGGIYNLACLYAIVKDKANALKYLEMALNKKEISIEDIKKDEDWDGLRNDADYSALLQKFK